MHNLPCGHNDLGRGLNGLHVVLILRHRLYGHALGRGHEQRGLLAVRDGHLQVRRRLLDVHSVPNWNDQQEYRFEFR